MILRVLKATCNDCRQKKNLCVWCNVCMDCAKTCRVCKPFKVDRKRKPYGI